MIWIVRGDLEVVVAGVDLEDVFEVVVVEGFVDGVVDDLISLLGAAIGTGAAATVSGGFSRFRFAIVEFCEVAVSDM